MSCDRCLLFCDPYCLEWDQEVPADHREDGCDRVFRDDDPEAFKRMLGKSKTTKDLWDLTHRWRGKEVHDDLWDVYMEVHERLVRKGENPCIFYARLEIVHLWCVEHLSGSEHGARPIDTEIVIHEFRMLMTEDEAKECLHELYKEGILKMKKTGKGESLFWVVL